MKMKTLNNALILAVVALLSGGFASGEADIGRVSYDFHLATPNNKIEVERFEDPDFKNVSCYISRSVLGGVEGAVGVANNAPDGAISCLQLGEVELNKKDEKDKRVFSERRSLIFKHLNVERFIDFDKGVLVYMLYTREVVSGSPKSSVSTVRIAQWSDNQ